MPPFVRCFGVGGLVTIAAAPADPAKTLRDFLRGRGHRRADLLAARGPGEFG